MQNYRFRFIIILLLASGGSFCSTLAQDALPSALGIKAIEDSDVTFNVDNPEDAPLPQAIEPGQDETGLSAIFNDADGELKTAVRADARLTYDDNIFINRRDGQADLIFTLSPTIAAGIGDVRPEFRRLALSTLSPAVIDESYNPGSFLFARYTPTLSVFFDNSGEDALDHDAAVEAQWRQNYLKLGSETRFQTLSDIDIDVGDRVRRSIFSQDFTGLYDYSDRTAFEFRLRGLIRHYPSQIDSQEVIMQNAVNYRVGARTLVGLGLTLGWLHAEGSGDQPYEQLLIRGRYHLSEKIDLYGNLGIEFRQLERREDRIEPVFQAGLSYQPWEQTSLTLGLARRVDNSAGTPGFDLISTEVDFEVRQRFAGHYYIGFVARYQSAQYLSIVDDSGARRDEIVLLRPYAKMDISKSAAIEVGYSFRSDDSNVDRFTFKQNRVYVQFDALF